VGWIKSAALRHVGRGPPQGIPPHQRVIKGQREARQALYRPKKTVYQPEPRRRRPEGSKILNFSTSRKPAPGLNIDKDGVNLNQKRPWMHFETPCHSIGKRATTAFGTVPVYGGEKTGGSQETARRLKNRDPVNAAKDLTMLHDGIRNK